MTLQANIDIFATVFSAPEWESSGKDEPIAFTTKFGEGRSFNLLLGHDTKGMDSAAFEQLLCRGVEWEATGKFLAGKN
ncbi:MAG: ThuA domain-containing protein [Verrucomicrobiota bacterium]